MNEKINAILNGLSPELQEKAKDIKTQEELMEFLSENDVELPEDALDAVAGGSSCDGPCAHTSASTLESFYGADVVPPGLNGEYRCAQCNACGAILYYFNNRPYTKAQYDHAKSIKEEIDRWEEERRHQADLDEAIYRFGQANPWVFR